MAARYLLSLGFDLADSDIEELTSETIEASLGKLSLIIYEVILSYTE